MKIKKHTYTQEHRDKISKTKISQGRYIDLEGQKFGRLTVLSKGTRDKDQSFKWLCRCECGNEKLIRGDQLKKGTTKSCGCLQKEIMSLKLINLIGKRFGRWIVLSLGKRKSDRGKSYWLCKCDCGNVKEVSGASLRNNTSVSCGCYAREIQGIRKPDNISFFKNLYGDYKSRSRRKGLDFKIIFTDFLKMIQSKCTYCDSEPNNQMKSEPRYSHVKYNGIDRIDNSIGYIYGNIVTCCKDCNYAKNTMSENEFVSLITKIYEHYIINKEWQQQYKLKEELAHLLQF